MTNTEMKNIIKDSRYKQYEIAGAIGISEFLLSKWFRKSLTDEQQKKILDALAKLGKGRQVI